MTELSVHFQWFWRNYNYIYLNDIENLVFFVDSDGASSQIKLSKWWCTFFQRLHDSHRDWQLIQTVQSCSFIFCVQERVVSFNMGLEKCPAATCPLASFCSTQKNDTKVTIISILKDQCCHEALCTFKGIFKSSTPKYHR